MKMKEGTPPNMINLAEESRSSESIENVGLDDDRYFTTFSLCGKFWRDKALMNGLI